MTSQMASPRDAVSARTVRSLQYAMHVLFLALTCVGLIRALTMSGSQAGHALVVICAATFFLIVYASGFALEKLARKAGHAPDDDVSSQVWISALVIAWVALLFVAHDFAWVAFAPYFLILHVARRPLAALLVLATCVASVVSLSRAQGMDGPGVIAGPIIGMLVALGIAWLYAQVRQESASRQRLVDQLVDAQADVLTMQEELAVSRHAAGVQAERERLARDIHDTLAQEFSSIVLLARAGLAGTADAALLRQIEQTAAEGLTQSREVVHALAPQELSHTPLAAALERLCARLADETGVEARAHVEGEARPLPATLDVALLRIAQGALANVRQHAQATRVGLTLTYTPGEVSLEIIDDGVGFTEADVARAPLSGSGFGIRAMRERVRGLGGHTVVESRPGDGAAVLVTLPVGASS